MCKMLCEVIHMATNLSVDPDLIEQARKVSGERTKAAAVTRALQEFIARRSQQAMLSLRASSNGMPDMTIRKAVSKTPPRPVAAPVGIDQS
jgi:hypothetical protein